MSMPPLLNPWIAASMLVAERNAVENFRLADQAVELYDVVARTCAAGGTLRVQGQDSVVLASIPCRRALKPRPVWYEMRN
jgi:hypothetical protein